MFGVLSLYKPMGMSSRGAVDHIQRLCTPHKAGHAGTLDPLAEGVLLVAIGLASRLVPYLQAQDKEYEAEFQLGCRSDSADLETEVEQLPNAPIPSLEKLTYALQTFTGVISQRPPAYSAVRVRGRRAHELVRKGKKLKLRNREVTIHELKIIEYSFPILRLHIRCGSGTYIRTLGRDLARSVGSEAVMTHLVRTRIGAMHISDTVYLDQLLQQTDVRDLMLKPQDALGNLPRTQLNEEGVFRVFRGMYIDLPEIGADAQEVVGMTESQHMLALLVRRENRWGPIRTFPTPETDIMFRGQGAQHRLEYELPEDELQ